MVAHGGGDGSVERAERGTNVGGYKTQLQVRTRVCYEKASNGVALNIPEMATVNLQVPVAAGLGSAQRKLSRIGNNCAVSNGRTLCGGRSIEPFNLRDG